MRSVDSQCFLGEAALVSVVSGRTPCSPCVVPLTLQGRWGGSCAPPPLSPLLSTTGISKQQEAPKKALVDSR